MSSAVGSPEWYDLEIDWLVAHEPLEQRVRIDRLVQVRNALARRDGKPERALPLHVSWCLMVDMAWAWRELWIRVARERHRHA